jgi:hypothetical protein
MRSFVVNPAAVLEGVAPADRAQAERVLGELARVAGGPTANDADDVLPMPEPVVNCGCQVANDDADGPIPPTINWTEEAKRQRGAR